MAAITTQEFEHHFKSLYKPLCLFALRYTDQVDDAEDIVQQAFADVWDKNRAGNVIGNLKAYLYQAVRNRSLSFTSRSDRRMSSSSEVSSTSGNCSLASAFTGCEVNERERFLTA